MKKINIFSKIILSVMALFFLSEGITYAARTAPVFFKRENGAIIMNTPTDTLGSPTTLISTGYFTNLFASTSSFTTVEITGASTGDLDDEDDIAATDGGLLDKILLATNFDATDSDVLSIVCSRVNGSTDVLAGFKWKEVR